MIATQRTQELGCGVYKPTREDIRRARKEIQASWSPQERAQRKRGPHAAWWIPSINRLSALGETVNEERAGRLPYTGAAGNESQREADVAGGRRW
jgi:hypothetical protein